jgi:hypothetical protein
MKLTDNEQRHVEEAVEAIGLKYDAIRDSYTGRGESKSCFGIKFSDPDQAQEFFVELAILNGDLAQALVSCCRHDGLGKGTITYFPGYQLNEE